MYNVEGSEKRSIIQFLISTALNLTYILFGWICDMLQVELYRKFCSLTAYKQLKFDYSIQLTFFRH